MLLGVDRLIRDSKLRSKLKGKRVALLAHPASVTSDVVHSVDALASLKEVKLVAAFGPQHGMRGDKQDNMIESEDYQDPVHGIPVYSLYGKVRRPTQEMLQSFDVILVDLQDIGCRIYTFLTSLRYLLEACGQAGKSVWILDRPNPAGRPIEGSLLRKGWESFVGAGAVLMRHGLTLGEAAKWFVRELKLDVELDVVQMEGYDPSSGPGYGWPIGELTWINPSPNASNITMARCYSGTVLIEGTNFSEGRGTTRPLEVVGAPDLDVNAIVNWMYQKAPTWLEGCRIRPCFFEPTFHKYQGKLCRGIQIHVDDKAYNHEKFKPYRLISLWLKAVRNLHKDYNIWRSFQYEYEAERLAIDLISGGSDLRKWVDDSEGETGDYEKLLFRDEKTWEAQRKDILLY